MGKQLIPKFLISIDLYLLANFPIIWRTRIHYCLFFFLFIGNIISFSTAISIPITLTNSPSVETVNSWAIVILLIEFLLLIYWIYELYNKPKGIERPFDTVKTYLLFFCIILSSLSNLYTFVLTCTYRIANITANVEFYEDYEFHQSFSFWYETKEVMVVEYNDSIKAVLDESLERFAIPCNYQVRRSSFDRNSSLIFIGEEEVSFGRFMGLNLKQKFDNIDHAKALHNFSSGIYFEQYIKSIPLIFIAVLTLSLILILILNPISYVQIKVFSNSKFDHKKIIQMLPWNFLLEGVDRLVAIYYPTIWGLKIHDSLLRLFFLLIGMIFTLMFVFEFVFQYSSNKAPTFTIGLLSAVTIWIFSEKKSSLNYFESLNRSLIVLSVFIFVINFTFFLTYFFLWPIIGLDYFVNNKEFGMNYFFVYNYIWFILVIAFISRFISLARVLPLAFVSLFIFLIHQLEFKLAYYFCGVYVMGIVAFLMAPVGKIKELLMFFLISCLPIFIFLVSYRWIFSITSSSGFPDLDLEGLFLYILILLLYFPLFFIIKRLVTAG